MQCEPKMNEPVSSEISRSSSSRLTITVNVGVNGSLHVWDPLDVIVMQSRFRIMGNAVGCFAKIPIQDIFTSLPVRLIPAEAAWLRDEGVAEFVDEMALTLPPTAEQREVFAEHRKRLFLEQIKSTQADQLAKLELHKEKILSGKLKKLKVDPATSDIDTEMLWKKIREDSLNRITSSEWSSRIESPGRSWRITMGLLKLPEYNFKYPQTDSERVVYAAYSALMKAGFWITSGTKYGGDFLLYIDDVHVNHSLCIVCVKDDNQMVLLEDILRIGRVATSCNKAVLWATVSDDFSVSFTCSKWALMK